MTSPIFWDSKWVTSFMDEWTLRINRILFLKNQLWKASIAAPKSTKWQTYYFFWMQTHFILLENITNELLVIQKCQQGKKNKHISKQNIFKHYIPIIMISSNLHLWKIIQTLMSSTNSCYKINESFGLKRKLFRISFPGGKIHNLN